MSCQRESRVLDSRNRAVPPPATRPAGPRLARMTLQPRRSPLPPPRGLGKDGECCSRGGCRARALRRCAASGAPPPSRCPPRRPPVMDGWLDLAKLVASEGSKTKGVYDELAYRIGLGVLGRGLGCFGGVGRWREWAVGG